MGKPRFRPAQIFANPRHFGRERYAQSLATASIGTPERAWAWYQHCVALAVREELTARSMSVAEFAIAINADEAWLTRKLHGQAPADLGELFEWALYLGVQILPEVNSAADLLGPSYVLAT